MNWAITGIIMLVSVLTGIFNADAATITVPSGGDIQAYINSANNYDTVLLSPGNYYPANNIQITRPITLKGSGSHDSVIHGRSGDGANLKERMIIISGTRDVTLFNFTMQGDTDPNDFDEYAVLVWDSEDITIASVYIYDFDYIGCGVVYGNNVALNWVRIWDNGIMGDSIPQQAIFALHSQYVNLTGLSVRNSGGGPSENGAIGFHHSNNIVISQCTSYGVGSGCSGFNNTSFVQIDNCRFVGASEFGIDIVNGSNNFQITNNIIDGTGAGAVVINDFLWGGTPGCAKTDEGAPPFNIHFENNQLLNVTQNIGIDAVAIDMSTITHSNNTYTGSFFCDGYRDDPSDPNYPAICSNCWDMP